MSIYTDFTANPNSENSFFSVPNVIARVSEIISNESTLLNLEEELKKYYIPAFTVDFTDNYVVVKVHPLGQEKTTLYISRTGSSEIEVVSTNSTATADAVTGFSVNISGATKDVKVNPAIHSDPNVKRPLVNMPLADETGDYWFSNNHSWQPIETLFLTSMPDDTEARTAKYNSMKSDLSIVLQIVADRMNTLDPEVLENLKSVYRDWVVKIEQLIEFLTLLSEQQNYLLEIIEWEKIIDNYLNLINIANFFTYSMTPVNNENPVEWSLENQSLEQLLETIKGSLASWHDPTYNWHDGLNLNGGTWSSLGSNLVYPDSDDPYESGLVEPTNGPVPQAYTHLGLADGHFYPANFTDPILPWTEDKCYDLIREKIFENHSQLQSNFQEVQATDFSDVNSGTIKDWYAEEIDSILTGEESPARAEAWLDNYELLSEPMIKTLKTFISGGSGLLVEQSIIKAISDLSNNGIELGDFLSRDDNGNDLFAEVGSGTAVGLKSPRPFANPLESQMQSDNPPDPPIPLSNANYLNYALLIRYLRKIKTFFSSGSSWFSYYDRIGFRDTIFEATNERWNPDIISLDDFLNHVGTTKLRTVWDPDRTGAELTTAESLWSGDYQAPNTAKPMTSHMSARQIIGTNWVQEEKTSTNSYSKLNIDPVVDVTYQNRYIQDPDGTQSYVPSSGPVNFWVPTSAKYDGWNDLADGADITIQNEIKTDFHVQSAGSQINTVKARPLTECVLDSEWVSLADEWYKDNFNSNFDFGSKMKEKSDIMRVLPTGMYTGLLFCGEKPNAFGDWSYLDSQSSKKKTSLWKFAWGGNTTNLRGPLSWGSKCGLESFSFLPNYNPPPADQLQEDPADDPEPPVDFEETEREDNVVAANKGIQEYDVPTDNGSGNMFDSATEIITDVVATWIKSGGKPSGFTTDSKVFFGSRSEAKKDGNDNRGFLIPIEWKIFTKGRELPEDGSEDYVLADREAPAMKLNVNQTYFKMKGGGLQRIAGTLEGVLKYVHARSIYYLYEFLGEEIGFSSSSTVFNELVEDADIRALWWPIFSNTIERVYQDCKVAGDSDKWSIKINHDGRIVMCDAHFGNNLYYDPVIQRQAENTVGVNNLQLIKEYANFQMLVSSKNKITITSNPDREINWNSFYPLEILKLSSNPNYLNSYGNFAQYAPPRTTSLVRDPLCFTRSEIYAPGSIDSYIPSPYKLIPYGSRKAWLLCWGSYLQIQNLLENIDEPIRSFRDYIQDLEINEEVKEPYQEGLVTKDDISKSTSILRVFQENMELYQADVSGISNYWKSIVDNDLQVNGTGVFPFSYFDSALTIHKYGKWNAETEQMDINANENPGKWLVACIGLSDEFVEYTQSKSENGYIIDLDYQTAGWNEDDEENYGIHRLVSTEALARAKIKIGADGNVYWEDMAIDSNNKNQFTNQKRSLLNWIHLSKGFNLDESSFIPGYEQLYSDFLINNEADIFPWSSSDFDGQRAIVNVETMYNVSPWLFPKNFYIDVVKARDFRYTIPVLIKVPIDESGHFQGNIKFKVTEL